MTEFQSAAQSSAPTTKRTQQQRILDIIAEQGFITMLGAWELTPQQGGRLTKLATRISEIESRCGHRFVHEAMYRTDSEGHKQRYNTRYTIPAGLTIEDFKA